MTDMQAADSLLEKGIKAAKTGDYATARPMLERVVELDQHNEKAWFWLAAITDDIDEKRICLNNVLVINPDNERAAALLRQLEESAAEPAPPPRDEIDPPPAPSKRDGRLAGVLLAVLLIILVLGGVGLLLLNSGDESDDAGTNTAITVDPEMAGPDGPPLIAGAPMGTPAKSLTPSPLPPTWTPVPTTTPIPDVLPTIFPPPPSPLPGQIILESGNVPGDRENHPIVLMAADGSVRRVLTGESRGHAPVLSPTGAEYAFIEYQPGLREETLTLNNIQGTNSRNASIYWQNQDIGPLFEPDTPDWSPNGRWLVFTAVGMGALLPDLYRVALFDSEGSVTPLERLTDDDTIESWPAYSPDGGSIVYVADTSQMEFELTDVMPVDLRIYDFETGTTSSLTNDGSALIEAAPSWSPDGRSIIFQGREAESDSWDIYHVSLAGDSEPETIIASDFDDIRPRYSPDGQHVVYSSNRAGNWDVFVYRLADDESYQLTTDVEDDIANDWSR